VLYVRYTLENGAELQKRLDALEKKTGSKIVSMALRAAQKLLLDRSKAEAKMTVGGDMGKAIAGALQLRVMKKRKGSYGLSLLLKKNEDFRHKTKSGKVRRTDKSGQEKYVKGDYYIPAAIEYGHIAQNGTIVRPLSFLRQPDKATVQQRLDMFQKDVKQGIETIK
jgi:hypothetical protein